MAVPVGRRRITSAVAGFWTGIAAVGAKELRGRMRGRRAFVVVTVYLLLLGLFAFGVYQYLKQQSAQQQVFPGGPFPGQVIDPFPGREFPGGAFPGPVSTGTALSATIGHALFGGLLMVETLLVLVLAPAFTSGAISLEREKQTLDLLVATPLSTLGMVVGKLLSALTYVFLLIVASIPLASVVFAFGGVGPEDLVRGYIVLFALAFGAGAIGLFISALVRRTQTATVVTFVTVLALTLGTTALHKFWMVTSQPTSSNGVIVLQKRHQAPEALLYMNPFVAGMDLVCTTAPTGYHQSCDYMSEVTGKPYFGLPTGTDCSLDPNCAVREQGWTDRIMADDVAASIPAPAIVGAPACEGGRDCFVDADFEILPAAATTTSLGFPRDVFWPRSVAAFLVVGIVLTMLSAQLVAPTRRLRLPRPRRRSHRVDPVAEVPA
jgi:ABC-type transport system involved in multi-copper enzyme maturation permease subunit